MRCYTSVLILFLVACNDGANFNSQNPTQRGAAGQSTLEPPTTAEQTPRLNPPPTPTTPAPTNPTPPANPPTPVCTPTTAQNFNIILIFDNSGSQLTTDPLAIRRTAGLNFVTLFKEYKKSHPTADINMSVISFNTAPTRAASGWVAVAHAVPPIASLANDIVVATSNSNGNTVYSNTLTLAAAMFSELGPARISNHRNYVIFLTDGSPQESTPGILAAVQNLVSGYQAAFVTVLAGTKHSSTAESLVSSMALPTTDPSGRKHVGIYKRATKAEDLQGVFTDVFSTISTCQ